MTSAIEEIWPDDADPKKNPFPPAVRAGEWVFLSGQFVRDSDVGVDPNFPFYASEESQQSEYLFDTVEDIIGEAGGSLEDWMRIYQWREAPKGEEDWLDGKGWTSLNISRYIGIKGERIPGNYPGSSHMGVLNLPTEKVADVPSEDVVLMLDGIFRTGDEEKNTVMEVPDIAEVESNYARVLEKGGFLFTAGEVPTDWTGDWGVSDHRPDRFPSPKAPEYTSIAPEARSNPYFWYGEPIKKHTDYTLEVLDKIVEQADTPIENTVKAEVYLSGPEDFVGFEEVWNEWFPEYPPARVVVPHQGVGTKGGLVEIALQLVHPDSGIEVETIETDHAPTPVTSQPQAVRAGDLLFVSGQMAHDEDGVSASDPNVQMNQILDNISAICEAAGTSLENAARCQGFFTSPEAYSRSRAAWKDRFDEGPAPAHTPLVVGDPLFVPGCEMLLEMVVYAP